MKDLLGDRAFFIPESKANDRNPDTGESAVFVSINSKVQYIPVGKEVTMSYEAFCVLRDAGIFGPNSTYVAPDDFDPMRP